MASASIDVYVKLPSGKAISLQHWPADTVKTIVQKVADGENIPERRVRLKYQGKVLDESKTIAYLGICAETILKVEIVFPKDIKMILQLPDGGSEEIIMQTTDTVACLKNTIWDKSAIPSFSQVLKLNKASITGDTKMLCDVGIDNQTVVIVEKKSTTPATTDADTSNVQEEEIDENMKQDLLNTFDSAGRNVEVVFCFDTTGSMYSCIQAVRTKLRETCTRLLQDIPNMRIGIMANGDYCDCETYVVKYEDLTTDVDKLVNFATNVPHTSGGGNGGEAYEWALRKAQQLDWSEDSAKAFVMIGDEPPHHKSYTDQNLFWKDEVDVLAGMGIKVYGVQAMHRGRSWDTAFYQELADRSGGFYLQLKDFSLITDMFLAVCYREADDGQLEDFVEEVEKEGRMTENTKLFLDKLEEQKVEPQQERARSDNDGRYANIPWWNPALTQGEYPEYIYIPKGDTWRRREPDIIHFNPGMQALYTLKKKSKLQRILSIFKRSS